MRVRPLGGQLGHRLVSPGPVLRARLFFPRERVLWLPEWTGTPGANVPSRREDEPEDSRLLTHKGSRPARQPRVGKCRLRPLPRCKGGGGGGLQGAPLQRACGARARSPAASRGAEGGREGACGGRDAVHLWEINSSRPARGMLPFHFGSPKPVHLQVLKIRDALASGCRGGPSRACAPSPARAVQKLSALGNERLASRSPPSGAPAPSLPRLLPSLGWEWNFPPLP